MAPLIFSLSVFLAGLLSFFSPCIFPLLPVYLGLLLDNSASRSIKVFGQSINWYSLTKTFAFIIGLSTVFVLLGYGAGLFGQLLSSNWLRYMLGGLVILFGLHQMEIINISFLQLQKKYTFNHHRSHGAVLKAFLVGVSFSLGWSPCIGPVLSSVLALAASGGHDTLQGGMLMFIYSLGLAIPFLLLALFSDILMQRFDRIKPYMIRLKKMGGILIIIMGLLLIFGNLNLLVQFIH